MSLMFCRVCGNIFQTPSNESIACPKCKGPDTWPYNQIVKRYFRCIPCNKVFKLSEVTAREIAIKKKNPFCPGCNKDKTIVSNKQSYLKASGRAKKHHLTYVKPLDIKEVKHE